VIETVVQEINHGTIRLPRAFDPSHPVIALVSGQASPFRLQNNNQFMPTIDDFLQPLNTIDNVATSLLKPHSIVSVMHSAVFHPNVRDRLSSTIHGLLDKEYSVYIRLTSAKEHGLALDSSLVVIVATRSPIPLTWDLYWPLDHAVSPSAVQTIIHDLKFVNGRAYAGKEQGFMCSAPHPLGPGRTVPQNGTDVFYNHQTGRKATERTKMMDMLETNLELGPPGAVHYTHPSKCGSELCDYH